MFSGRVEKNRVGRETGTTCIFHLGLAQVVLKQETHLKDSFSLSE